MSDIKTGTVTKARTATRLQHGTATLREATGRDAATNDASQSWNWGTWEVVRWKIWPEWMGGGDDVVYQYKESWVRAHSETIASLSQAHNLPPELLAGVAYIEVGGDPEWIDSIAYNVRSFDHSGDPWLEPLTVTRNPELTSFGDVSIQLRRAAETLGREFSDLTAEDREQLIEMLANEDQNLAIVARHLSQLKQIDFPNQCVLSDLVIRITGTRYNRGPDLSLDQILQNTSYGDYILQRRSRLLQML